MVLAMVRQLVNQAHVPPQDIIDYDLEDGNSVLETLDEAHVRGALSFALGALGQAPAAGPPREMLEEALVRFDPSRIPREPLRAPL